VQGGKGREMALKDRRLAFTREYPKDQNATQAAIRAGYSEKTAYSQGQRLLKDNEVIGAIAKCTKKAVEKAEINVEKVLRGINAIAECPTAKNNDKLKAYELLGKYLSMFTDKQEIKGDIDNHITIKFDSPDDGGLLE
jgi:phage terminase small subunit